MSTSDCGWSRSVSHMLAVDFMGGLVELLIAKMKSCNRYRGMTAAKVICDRNLADFIALFFGYEM